MGADKHSSGLYPDRGIYVSYSTGTEKALLSKRTTNSSSGGEGCLLERLAAADGATCV